MAYSRDQLIERIQQAAAAAGINPAVAVAQLRRESANFRSDVVYGPFVGAAGERGLAQFTPGTWARFGSGAHTNAYDLDASIAAYLNYMGYLLRLFSGDYAKALTGYNGGEGHLTDPGKYGPPSQAAQRYAREVLQQAGAGAAPLDDDDGGSDWLSYVPYLAGAGLLVWFLVDD